MNKNDCLLSIIVFFYLQTVSVPSNRFIRGFIVIDCLALIINENIIFTHVGILLIYKFKLN